MGCFEGQPGAGQVKTMQTTYVAVKPDGVQRGLVGEIVNDSNARASARGHEVRPGPDQTIARTHYAVHAERPFFEGLIETS